MRAAQSYFQPLVRQARPYPDQKTTFESLSL